MVRANCPSQPDTTLGLVHNAPLALTLGTLNAQVARLREELEGTHAHYQKLLEAIGGPAWAQDMGPIERGEGEGEGDNLERAGESNAAFLGQPGGAGARGVASGRRSAASAGPGSARGRGSASADPRRLQTVGGALGHWGWGEAGGSDVGAWGD